MLNNIYSTLEFIVYHLLIVFVSRISKIPIKGTDNQTYSLFMRRYLASMNEVRLLKKELDRVNRKNKNGPSLSLQLRFAQVLSYVITRGDKTYHKSYLSTTKATAVSWSYKFRHPIRSRKKENKGGRPRVTPEVVELILQLKNENKQWGTERIRDELRKLGINHCKETISKVLKEHGFDPFDDRAKNWYEQWKSEAKDHTWAVDFFFVETIKEASCMVLLLIDVYTREILSINVHEGREGIDSFWVAGKVAQVMTQTKRKPQRLIHDRDPLFKGQVMRMCAVADIKEMRVPPKYPSMNGVCERNIQSIKFELTNHIKARDGNDLQQYLNEYQEWFNHHRPHQGIGGIIPADFANDKIQKKVISIEELRSKKLGKKTFCNGLLHSFVLVDDLKQAA